MSDANTYPVNGNIDFRIEQAIVDVLKYNDTITAIFGSPDSVDIRRAKDKSKGEKSLPVISVECLLTQSLPRTNEYQGRVQITCATQIDADADGQMIKALAAAVRDLMHEDSTPDYVGHFSGDCNGFLQALNATNRDVVVHQIHEGSTDPDDRGRTRVLVMNVDLWGYPGKVK